MEIVNSTQHIDIVNAIIIAALSILWYMHLKGVKYAKSITN